MGDDASPGIPPIETPYTMEKKQASYKKRMDEAQLYTSGDDAGGWGSKNSFLRNHLDAPNTTKCAWASLSPRFRTSKHLVDKMYDEDVGWGNKRSMELCVSESPRRYGAVFNDTPRFRDKKTQSTSAIYDIGDNAQNGSVSSTMERTLRNYSNMKSVVPRGKDPREGQQAGIGNPDYDFGDGPKPSFEKIARETPRKYCMMSSTEVRGGGGCRDGPDTKVDPVEDYDTNTGRNITLARSIELTGIEYANMRSKVDRFPAPDDADDLPFRAQDLLTIGKHLNETPRRYHGVGTKTPRFQSSESQQGGQDFYEVDTGPIRSISNGIDQHPVRYRGSIGSQTARFAKNETGYGAREGGDPDGMNYNTDYAHKATLATSIEKGSQKYSLFRSKVPRFRGSESGKKKGKKLDMDAVYEAELKRVTGVREAAEYYIPNFGTHRGLSESVKRSTRKYASSFASKQPRFKEAKEED